MSAWLRLRTRAVGTRYAAGLVLVFHRPTEVAQVSAGDGRSWATIVELTVILDMGVTIVAAILADIVKALANALDKNLWLCVVVILILALAVAAALVLPKLKDVGAKRSLVSNEEGHKREVSGLKEEIRKYEALLAVDESFGLDLPRLFQVEEQRKYLDEAMSALVQGCAQVVANCRRAAVLIPDESGNNLTILGKMGQFGYNHKERDRFSLPIRPEISFAGAAYLERTVKYAPDRTKESLFKHHTAISVYRYTTVLDIPILVDTDCVGVLNLDSDKYDAFGESDIARASFLADKIGFLFLVQKVFAAGTEVAPNESR